MAKRLDLGKIVTRIFPFLVIIIIIILFAIASRGEKEEKGDEGFNGVRHISTTDYIQKMNGAIKWIPKCNCRGDGCRDGCPGRCRKAICKKTKFGCGPFNWFPCNKRCK